MLKQIQTIVATDDAINLARDTERLTLSSSVWIADLADELLFNFDDFELFGCVTFGVTTEHCLCQMPLNHLVGIDHAIFKGIIDIGKTSRSRDSASDDRYQSSIAVCITLPNDNASARSRGRRLSR